MTKDFNIYGKNNYISEILESVKTLYFDSSYGNQKSTTIFGLLCVDQNGKPIAINKTFHKDISAYDISILSSAIYGLSDQGKKNFDATIDKKDRIIHSSSLNFNDIRFITFPIGEIFPLNKSKIIILISVIIDNKIKFQILKMYLNQVKENILKEIHENSEICKILGYDELQMAVHIENKNIDNFKKNNY